MPWRPKPRPVTLPLRIEQRLIDGKMRDVIICPPRPADGAWYAEGNPQLGHREKLAPPHL